MSKPEGKAGKVATVIRLCDYDRRDRDPPAPGQWATIVILPVIRLERHDLKSGRQIK